MEQGENFGAAPVSDNNVENGGNHGAVPANGVSEENKARFNDAAEKIIEANRGKVEDRIARTTLEILDNEDKDEYGLSLGDFLSKEDTLSPENTVESEESDTVDHAELAMQALIRKNVEDSAKAFFELEAKETEGELLLKYARKKARDNNRKNGGNRRSTRLPEVTDRILDSLNEVSEKKEQLSQKSPESYTVVKGFEFRKLIKDINQGGIAVTPYVKKNLDRIQGNMESGRPTFIHGHLGSGKTELAVMAAKNVAISKAAYQDALKECARYKKEDNPDCTQEDMNRVLRNTYRKSCNRYKNALKNGDQEAVKRFTPLVISGSKDLTNQELYSDKTLKLKSASEDSLEDHVAAVNEEFAKWEKANPEDAKDPEKRNAQYETIRDMYKMSHEAFGTEVVTIDKEIKMGVEQGRPVIIDEANAIPAAVLISLNDILTKRPGEKCNIPGFGSVEMKEGFSLTMTGNISSSLIDYGGTEDLNPALLSRLDLIEHDYLPMSDNAPNYEESDPDRNELFKVVVASLAERTGDVILPEPEKTFKQLFHLAQLAHDTQLVFAGKWKESNVKLRSESGDEVEPSLEKSVLSTRNLLNVLEMWNKGEERDLNMALWEGFIMGIPNANDRNRMLVMAYQRGFFQQKDGWDIKLKEDGSSATTFEEAYKGINNDGVYYHERKPLEVVDLRKVVEVLYGKGPEREIYPDIDLDELEENLDVEPTDEDYEKIDAMQTELEGVLKALERLGEQCGCDVASNKED